MKILLSGNDWKAAHMMPSETNPTVSIIKQIASGSLYGPDFINATVPGDVQSDAIEAGLIPPIEYGFNSRAGEWAYQRDWVMCKAFTPAQPVSPYSRVMLKFGGVDYACDVFLNGQWLGYHEVAWTAFEFDVTDLLKYDSCNSLIVIIKNAPEAECQWGRTSAVKHLKARFAYGWDWCTRMVPLGIWKDVELEYCAGARISNLWVRQNVNLDDNTATVRAVITVDCEQPEETLVNVTFRQPNGESVTASINECLKNGENILTHTINLDNPMLWYPNGYGEQPLYELTAELTVQKTITDCRTVQVGLRKVEWLYNDNAPESALKYVVKINGKRIFLKGYNVTPIRQLYGRVHYEQYKRRAELAKEAHCNFFRVWGGGLAEREEFYRLCDEMGILVMQELFQSSAAIDNHPSMDEEFISLLTNTAQEFIKERRNHACLIIWCGGNELCTRGEIVSIDGEVLRPDCMGLDGYKTSVDNKPWLPLTPEYPTLKVLGEVVLRTDPDRRWLHTSGSGPTENASLNALGNMHDVHGPWNNLGPLEQYNFYNKVDMYVHMEFGCDGSASLQAMRTFMPEDKLWPIDSTNTAAWHHGRMYTVNIKERTEEFFGEIDCIEDFCEASRFVQAEGIRYAIEAHRRRKWQASGCVLWHMAEPWPNACDTCSIDFYLQPKPAYYLTKQALSQVHISAQYDTVIWGDKNEFSSRIFLHNATDKPFSGRAEIKVVGWDGKIYSSAELEVIIEPEGTKKATEITLNPLPNQLFLLIATLYDGDKEVSKHYSVHSPKKAHPYKSMLRAQRNRLKVEYHEKTITLKNEGDSIMCGVLIETPLDEWVTFSDNYLALIPGETKRVIVDNNFTKLLINGFGVLPAEIISI